MNNTQPHYVQMLFQQLQTRQMMKVDVIEWREFSDHLDKQPAWSNMKDIPTFLSLLIAWAHTQLTALTAAEGGATGRRTLYLASQQRYPSLRWSRQDFLPPLRRCCQDFLHLLLHQQTGTRLHLW